MLDRLRLETAENRDSGDNLQVAGGGMQGHTLESRRRGANLFRRGCGAEDGHSRTKANDRKFQADRPYGQTGRPVVHGHRATADNRRPASLQSIAYRRRDADTIFVLALQHHGRRSADLDSAVPVRSYAIWMNFFRSLGCRLALGQANGGFLPT
jgi:hypothetical protein